MSRTTLIAPLVAAAAVLAPTAGAMVEPGGYVHSPGPNGAAYVNALTGNRALSVHRSSPQVLITDNSPSQNRISARNTRSPQSHGSGRAKNIPYRVLYRTR